MALAERAELIARLSLKDDFSRKAKAASGAVQRMGVDFAKVGRLSKQGLSNAATNLTRLGVVAGGFVALNVSRGISSLAELEDAVTSVDGAIKQVGKGWTTSGQTIAKWANEIETATQRAFDDKEITQAATTLIRYGKISEQQLRPALEVMTDLAAKTGDVGSAGDLLAKSLAAPEKAAARLVRQGIVFNKTTQKQIELLVKSGKVGEAQALVLEEIAKQTKGAAAASAGPYRDALNILKDVTEDAQRALGEAFLPVISKVADKLSTELAKPETIRQLRDFGQTLAGAFDKALAIGGKIPWDTIGQSLKIAGTGARAVFDAFTSLPPWVQTAVITGWGLNKLTGGALGGIVGELGKGLIRGVLGINAGVVNVNGRVVNGAPGSGGGGGGIAGAVGGAIAAGTVVQGAMDLGTIVTGFDRVLKANNVDGVTNAIRDVKDGVMLLPPGVKGLMDILLNQVPPKITEPFDAAAFRLGEKVNTAGEVQRNALAQVRDNAERNRIALVNATNTSKSAIVASVNSDRNAIVSAIRNNRPIVNVGVVVNSTTNRIVRNYTTGSQVGRTSGQTEYDR